jgi:hypothetical protein
MKKPWTKQNRYVKKLIPERTVKVYEFIKNNPGCTAIQIARGVGMDNYRMVYTVISSFENHDNKFPVSEDNGVYYPFDFERCEENFWTNDY